MILACMTQEELPEPINGAKLRWCLICAEPIWVAPSSQDLVDNGTLKPHCMHCTEGLLATEKNPEWGIHPRQRQQLIELGRYARHAALISALNEMEQQNGQ